jgi:hypothetical protein
MKINIKFVYAIIASLAVASVGSEAAAQNYPSSGYGSIDKMRDAGRYGTGRVGRFVGNRMCGSVCGRVMQRGTNRVYDGSREFASRRGEQLRNWSRRHIAPRIRRR